MSRPVLLIEDNAQNRYLATFLLEQAGYQVVAASDGPQGLAMAETVQPSLILLDIQLPVMDGYAVARLLRRVPALLGTPIVAVTSFAMPGDRVKAMASGCTGYVEKPIDPDSFLDTLRDLGLPPAPGRSS